MRMPGVMQCEMIALQVGDSSLTPLSSMLFCLRGRGLYSTSDAVRVGLLVLWRQTAWQSPVSIRHTSLLRLRKRWVVVSLFP